MRHYYLQFSVKIVRIILSTWQLRAS